MKKLPPEVVNDLMNDQDFLGLDESGQDEILDEIQKKLGIVEPSESVFQRALKYTQQVGQEFMEQGNQFGYGFTDEALLGVPEMAKGIGVNLDPGQPKNIMQNVARGAGRVGGFAFGAPEHIGASVSKKIANPLLKGMAHGASSMASMSPSSLISGESSVGKEVAKVGAGGLVGGVTEAAFPIISNAFFRKNISKAKADELSTELGKVKESIKNNPNSYVDATGLWTKLNKIYDNAAPEVQRKIGVIKRWADDIGNKGMQVHPDFVRQMEEELGSQAKFHSQKSGFFQFLSKPKSPGANRALQEGRTAASDEYDTIASQAGHPEFRTKSKELSKILKKYPDEDPSKTMKNLGVKVASAIAGTAVTHNPFVGLGIFLGETAAQNPAIKQGLFKAVSSPKGQSFLGNLAKSQRAIGNTAIQRL